MKVSYLFAVVGFALLMLSPGNIHRLEITNLYEPSDIVPPDAQFTPQMFLTNFVVGFLPVFLRELILFVPIIIYFARGKISSKTAGFILTFAGASILVLLVMMCSPEFPQRAGFPSTVFLLIGSLAWGGDLESFIKDNRVITFARYHGLKKIVVEEKSFE